MNNITTLALFFFLGLWFHASGQVGVLPPPVPNQGKARFAESYGKLPLSFETNAGQADKSVKFVSHGNGYQLYLTDEEAALTLQQVDCATRNISSLRRANLRRNRRPCTQEAAVVRMHLQGARREAATPVGEEKLPGSINYLIGNDPARWHTGLPTYAKVRYRGVYPGVDLVYYGNQRQLEYDFVVAPGADPRRIRLRFAGAKDLRIGTNGDLTVRMPGGEIAFHKPTVYQPANGRRKPITGEFALAADQTVSFSLGRYDRKKPLVIDPVLVFSTYLGGNSEDTASAIVADAEGNVYVTGTASYEFPVTSGALQQSGYFKIFTAFVTKFNQTGTALLYSTYLGGTEGENVGGLAVDAAGSAYLAGSTNSADFPVTQGAFQTTMGGMSQSGFVSKLNPTGTALVYSTYLGGSSGDGAEAIAVDTAGNTYVGGYAYSADFPVTAGAFQTQNNAPGVGNGSGSNAFVAKLNPTGTGLVYSTYLGGSGFRSYYMFTVGEIYGDGATGLSVDSEGNAYLTGYAYSANFPVTEGAFQTRLNGVTGIGLAAANPGHNAFITKLNPTGTALLYSTYLGGSAGDSANGIAVDARGNAFVAGVSTSSDFPITKGAFQTTTPGQTGFVSKLNPTGSALVYSTYLGGYNDSPKALVVDEAGDAFIDGTAYSTDFPVTTGALQTTNKAAAIGTSNAFLAELNPEGAALVYSTYFGGSGADSGLVLGDGANGLALDGAGNVYITGFTSSADFPVTPGVFQQTIGNGQVGAIFPINDFVAKLDLGGAPPAGLSVSKTHAANFTQGQTGAAYTVTVSNASGAGATNGTVTVTETVPSGLTLVAMAGTGWNCASNACTRGDALASGASYPPITVTVNVAVNATSPQVNQVNVSGGGSAGAGATDSTTIVPPVISVATTALTFQVQQGAPAQSQSIQIGGTAGAAWQATAATSSGGSWLSVSPAAGQIPASLTVLVNPGSLAAGIYEGSVSIEAPVATPPSTTVVVTLTVTGTAAQMGVLFNNITNPAADAGYYPVFGTTGDFAVPYAYSDAALFTSSTGGMATDARVVIAQNGNFGPQVFNVAIYSDAGGMPGTQVSQTVTNIAAPICCNPGIITAPFSQPVPLSAGVPYWLVVTAASANTYVEWQGGGSEYVPFEETLSNSDVPCGWCTEGNGDPQFAVDAGTGVTALSVLTPSLPNATSGMPYSATLTATGGSGTGYTWSVSPGSLPAGFSLSSAGVLSTTGSPPAPANSYTLTVQVTDSAVNVATQALTLLIAPANSTPAPPSITSGGVVPIYSTVTTIQPGEWVSVYGTNLAASTTTWNGNFPTSLGGTSVTIDGKAAYLWLVSPTQINLQAPDDTATGSVPVVVTTSGGTFTSTVTLAQFGPSFNLLDSKHITGIISRSDGSGAYGGGTYDILGPTGDSLGYPTVAAKAGDNVSLYAVGMGPTTQVVSAGQVFSGAAATTYPVNLLIGGQSVFPTFAGLAEAGLYQINLTVPSGLGTGDVALVATVDGIQTQSGVVISLQ